jgi:arylsulfatase A-like enzyme
LALHVAVLGGFLFGVRESLLTLQANAFAQPGQYQWLFLAVPLLTWIGLAMVVLAVLSVTVAPWRRRPDPTLYAVTLAAAGTLSVLAPQIAATTRRLGDVGAAPGLGLWALFWTAALLLAATAGLVTAAVVHAYAGRWRPLLRFATWGILAIAAAAVWPPLRFLASDWKRGDGPVRASASGPAAVPDVVLISIDTLRADHLGAYGDLHGLTPHLDRLAGDGVVFPQAITASPWTLPAVASLLTAQYPHRHGAGAITNHRDPMGRSPLPPGSWNLASALHDLGYRTHAIVTNPYLALSFGLGAGFDSYENVSIESEAWLAFASTTPVRLLTWVWPDLMVGDRGETVSARAVHWLATRRGRQPFFLWLHYIDPHPPYSRPGTTHHKSFRGDTLLGAGSAATAPFPLTSPDVARLRSGEIRLSEEEKETVRNLYRAEVAGVDAAVGVVLDALDERRDRTLVVLVADHGEEFWEHGGVEHGHTTYEEVVRIPLLMRWPLRIPAGTRSGGVARIIDVAPTVLDLLGQPPPPARDGVSLVAQWRDGGTASRPTLIENMLFAEERVGLRTASHKYVRWANGREEVYALGSDPGEQRDLVALGDVLGDLQRLYAQTADGAPLAQPPRRAPSLNGATRDALHALGYGQ